MVVGSEPFINVIVSHKFEGGSPTKRVCPKFDVAISIFVQQFQNFCSFVANVLHVCGVTESNRRVFHEIIVFHTYRVASASASKNNSEFAILFVDSTCIRTVVRQIAVPVALCDRTAITTFEVCVLIQACVYTGFVGYVLFSYRDLVSPIPLKNLSAKISACDSPARPMFSNVDPIRSKNDPPLW